MSAASSPKATPLPPPALPERAWGRLLAILGPDGVSRGEAERTAYARDCWPRAVIEQRAGITAHPPDAIAWPRSAAEVAAVLRLAGEERFPVIPYGGGSGVCGGTVAVRGGVVLDVKRMNRLLEVRDEALLCEAEAGIFGQPFEEALNRRGYTLGHFPSSIACSTLGGWLAARSSGQASTRYGNIEDLCAGLEAVLASGAVVHAKPLPRSAAGPDWKGLLIGSEGTLGVITRATMRISPLAEARRFLCFRFPSVAAGVGAIRKVLRRGFRPAVVRLYDPLDTLVGVSGGGGTRGALAVAAKGLFEKAKGVLLSHPSWASLLDGIAGGCHAVFVCEGDREQADLEAKVVRGEALAAGAEDCGPGPAEHWQAHRFDVSYKGAPVFREGAFVDTAEVAAPWDRVLALYESVRAAIAPHAVVLAHFSHAYRDGCSIYFTFAAAYASEEETLARYDRAWAAALDAALAAGGTISHHHGVGLAKAGRLAREMGGFHDALVAVKRALDPQGILNPGKLGMP